MDEANDKAEITAQANLSELVYHLWTAIGDQIELWDRRPKEEANRADVDYALGVAAGLRMAMVMVRRVREREDG